MDIHSGEGKGTGDGTGEGEGGDGEKGDIAAANLKALETLTANMNTMGESVSSIAESVKSLQDKQAALEAGNGDGDGDGDGEDGEGEDDYSASEIENMNRADYTQHITKTVLKEVAKLIKPLDTKVDTAATTAYAADLQKQVDTLKEKNPDFMDWAPEIGNLIKDNPNLKVAQAYKLAKADDPEKVGKMKEKYKDTENAGDGDSNGKGKKSNFGGMRPSGSSKTAPVTNMKQDVAANAAYDKIFGDNAGDA